MSLTPLLDLLGFEIKSAYQQTIIILILTLLASIIVYKISGWCLDWIYDSLYPEKKNENSDLNKYINSARQNWISVNQIYESVSIYKPTLEKIEKNDKWEYKKIKEKLSISKLFRIIVIPTTILGIVKLISKDIMLGIICIIIAIICLIISFNFRAEHSKRMYRWIISSS